MGRKSLHKQEKVFKIGNQHYDDDLWLFGWLLAEFNFRRARWIVFVKSIESEASWDEIRSNVWQSLGQLRIERDDQFFSDKNSIVPHSYLGYQDSGCTNRTIFQHMSYWCEKHPRLSSIDSDRFVTSQGPTRFRACYPVIIPRQGFSL
jgi:hypothetical protein